MEKLFPVWRLAALPGPARPGVAVGESTAATEHAQAGWGCGYRLPHYASFVLGFRRLFDCRHRVRGIALPGAPKARPYSLLFINYIIRCTLANAYGKRFFACCGLAAPRGFCCVKESQSFPSHARQAKKAEPLSTLSYPLVLTASLPLLVMRVCKPAPAVYGNGIQHSTLTSLWEVRIKLLRALLRPFYINYPI